MPKSERKRFFDSPRTLSPNMESPPRTDGVVFHDPSLMHNSPRYVARSRSLPAQISPRHNQGSRRSRNSIHVMNSVLRRSFQNSSREQPIASFGLNSQYHQLASPEGSIASRATVNPHGNTSTNNRHGKLAVKPLVLFRC